MVRETLNITRNRGREAVAAFSLLAIDYKQEKLIQTFFNKNAFFMSHVEDTSQKLPAKR